MQSWVDGATEPTCPFPLQNLPYGVFSQSGKTPPRCGVAVGSQVLDLAKLHAAGLLRTPEGENVFDTPALNRFMSLGPEVWQDVREQLTSLLGRDESGTPREEQERVAACLIPLDEVRSHLPFEVTEFTDFYAGRQHAFNVGTMFRGPENALPPNWLHMPIGYNGRASSVVVSGTDIRRPCGQLKSSDAEMPTFGPCQRLDYELEFGAVVGAPSKMGERLSVAQAYEMIFGYVLLNDWSARDIQAWEYQPLGPFQAKACGTTISPWVVPAAALEPFRISAPTREKALLPYLEDDGPMHFDIELEVSIQPDGASKPTTLSRTNCRHLYYSLAQQLAHHASSGCPMRVGDLLGSGTISGSGRSQYGSLLELSWGGRDPVQLASGETRFFVEDGDTVTLHGFAQGDGFRIGFGDCTGKILPPRD